MYDNTPGSCRKRRMVGYNVKGMELFTMYICQICSFILRDPCQLLCGHRCCSSCLDAEEGSTVRCKICGTDTPCDKAIVDNGCRLDMERLSVICTFCDWTGLLKHYDEHLNQSHLHPFCQHCSREYDSINELTEHQLQCEKKPIDCTLKQHGCHEQYLRIDTHQHFLSEQHQRALIKSLATSIPPPPITDVRQSETMDLLVNSLHVLSDETQRLSSESIRQQNTSRALSDNYAKTQSTVQETQRLMEAQQLNQQALECGIASLQQQINEQKNVSYDGTLLWKITDVSQKIADAQAEKQTSIFSPPFYSSPTGYKACCRLYPFGDGAARRTHLSLFFVLLRGDYDSVLSFPFNFKITFALLDQSGQQRHIIDSFRPDTKSNSFQRPTLAMNIASGIPKFFPIPMLQQSDNPYVQDDAMFIRIIIDFDNVPKTMLPYMVNLNPALPRSVRQEMIRRETERRTQSDATTTNLPI